jgi:ectoine hydroxylase-related dioxygenase (phytanoyl-CoA dioxygenase family)
MYVTDEYHSKIHTTVESNEFDLLIFPSWLNHRSQPNKSNENRIAISMNFIGNWKLK